MVDRCRARQGRVRREKAEPRRNSPDDSMLNDTTRGSDHPTGEAQAAENAENEPAG